MAVCAVDSSPSMANLSASNLFFLYNFFLRFGHLFAYYITKRASVFLEYWSVFIFKSVSENEIKEFLNV